jgi:hypothetical protein
VKKLILSLLIVTGLLTNFAQAISCPNIPANEAGPIKDSNGHIWQIIKHIPPNYDSYEVIWNKTRDSAHYYNIVNGAPVCIYSLRLLTIQAQLMGNNVHYICSDFHDKVHNLCATNSFTEDPDTGG